MGLIEVKEYLKKYNKDKDIILVEESSATVEEAAHALNIEPGMIAKSLTFKVNGDIIMIVTKGTSKIDNSKYKHTFNAKAKMLTKEEVNEFINQEVGGVCPFALNPNIKVYLDISLKNYEFVYPACGENHSAIKLSINELEELSHFTSWIDVCKNF